MSGQHSEVCTPGFEVLSDGNVRDARVTLPRACADLLATLSLLTARKAVLNGELQATANDTVSAALDVVRSARRRSDELATFIMSAAPGTANEASLRLEALTAYLAAPDGDELLRSLLCDVMSTSIAGLPSPPESMSRPRRKASTWKPCVRPAGDVSETKHGRDQPVEDDRCPPL